MGLIDPDGYRQRLNRVQNGRRCFERSYPRGDQWRLTERGLGVTPLECGLEAC